ncbi:YceD family protein [Mucilaginibacter myungsuensis]|uniref:DUF177 domain-containing protein n=1 Tax=Mucilaginibacter myungsuensis TaxID=649104 RepID=A0A929PVU6_9SPHI|nr:DUF177 domain-containing protein [Mucilaginibacter myungsuensis]MBE9661489.1 DUF177 domain-containing protein [Mucilaginibacter myungsuensis]MDN3597632.1 DUF177 domain-containing protein [Mucilaginibacter myungsuensis]
MKALRTYAIPFTGLKLGKHEFDYVIKDDFFNEFEYSLVKRADLVCKVVLDKQETMLIIDFDISGKIDVACDRCLSEFAYPVDIQEQQIFKFSEEPVDEDDEVMHLGKADHEVDLAGLIYEYVNVAVPFVAYCEDGGEDSKCDQEMLDRLNKLSAGEEKDEPQADPRWDALKNIK